MNKQNFNNKKITFLTYSFVLVSILQAQPLDKTKEYELSEINIDANTTLVPNSMTVSQKSEFGSKTTINRQMIEATPSGNGDITSLLRTNPSVKFSNTNRQSTTMGEIDPADISINGARYYDNNFMIDGFNINNDIDPGGADVSGYGRNITGSALDVGAGVSQGMAIDSDFIENIDVYDSDVSAKYGNFTGGVIDAKTRNPKDGFHGKISMSHTRDSWAKYHLGESISQEDFENSTNASNQPKFQKYTTRLNLEGFLTDNFGIMFGYTNTRSKIPLTQFTKSHAGAGYERVKVNQRRNIDNYFLKGVWYATDRLTIKPSAIYAPQENKAFHDMTKDSFKYYKSGGLSLNLEAEYDFNFMKAVQKLNYSKLETSREALGIKNVYTWKASNLKPWGLGSSSGVSKEGAYGDIDQIQKTLSYNLDLNFDEFQAFNTSHKFIAGLELKKQNANYEIKDGFLLTSLPRSLGGSVCDPNDDLCLKDNSFGGNGQYFNQKTVYSKGKIKVNMNSWAFYLEDKIEIGKLTLRPGIRFDGNNYMNKKTIAPRFSASYDVFSDGDTVLNFGRNRYYGRNIFGYKLKDGRNSLINIYRRSPQNSYNTNWKLHTASLNNTKFSELDIPYDDETSFGIKQNLGIFNLGFKYIKRKGRDQIIRASAKNLGTTCGVGYQVATSCYIYTNYGKTDTKTYNITLSTNEPINFLGTAHTFELTYDHMDKKTNNANSSYDDNYNALKGKMVHFQGSIIDYEDLPISDYYRPWTLTLTTISQIPQTNLTISNFFTYKANMNSIARKRSINIGGTSYDNYELVNLGKSYSWDMRISHTYKLPKDMSAFINLDIYNVLDRANKATTASSTTTTLTYERGRQFWLEAGLKW